MISPRKILMVLSHSNRMPLMTNYCFDLHARLLLAHSKTSPSSLTSPQQWSPWLSTMPVAMVFKGYVTPLHLMNGVTNFYVSLQPHIAYSAVILEGGLSGASTKFAPKSPSSALVSHPVHTQGRGSAVLTITTHWMDLLQLELMTWHS